MNLELLYEGRGTFIYSRFHVHANLRKYILYEGRGTFIYSRFHVHANLRKHIF